MKAMKTIGLIVAVLAIMAGILKPWNWGGEKDGETKGSESKELEFREIQNKFPSDTLEIKPGGAYKVKGRGWSDVINVSFPGMTHHLRTKGGYKIKWDDGSVREVKEGEYIKKVKSFVFQIKTEDNNSFYIWTDST